MKILTLFFSLGLLFTFNSCVRQFYVDPNECKDVCYTLTGKVHDDSLGILLQYTKVRLKLDKGNSSVIIKAITDSLGEYEFNVSDSIVDKGYSKGTIRYRNDNYLNAEKEINFDTISLADIIYDLIPLRAAGSIFVKVRVNNPSIKRVSLIVKSETVHYYEIVDVSDTKPQLRNYYFPIAINENNLFYVKSSEVSHDSILFGKWQILDDFPKSVKVSSGEVKTFELNLD